MAPLLPIPLLAIPPFFTYSLLFQFLFQVLLPLSILKATVQIPQLPTWRMRMPIQDHLYSPLHQIQFLEPLADGTAQAPDPLTVLQVECILTTINTETLYRPVAEAESTSLMHYQTPCINYQMEYPCSLWLLLHSLQLTVTSDPPQPFPSLLLPA